MRIAAVEGLGTLSIGRLAKELRMSKSGLFVHFGSKEKLEMAIVERAYDIFCGCILLPAEEEVKPGIERVWVLCDLWLEFVENRVLRGGYFFTGARRNPQGSRCRAYRLGAEQPFNWRPVVVSASRRGSQQGTHSYSCQARRSGNRRYTGQVI